MKTTLLLLSLLFSVAGITQSKMRTWYDTTCFQLDSVRLWRTVDQPAYTIQIPSDWVLDDSSKEGGTDIIVYTYQETPKDSFTENVTVIRDNIQGTGITPDLEAYTENSYPLLTDMFRDFLEEENSLQINNGVIFHKWVYSGMGVQTRIKQVQYTFLKDEVIYIVTLTVEAEKFRRYQDVGFRILNSFSFK